MVPSSTMVRRRLAHLRPRGRVLQVGPPPVLRITVAGQIRGLHRIEDTSIEGYELYRGTAGADPDFDAPPFATSATLPITTGALGTNRDDRFVTRFRNRYNLVSKNEISFHLETDGSGLQEEILPLIVEQLAIEAWTAGTMRITGTYHYIVEPEAVRADEFALWITSDGTDPDPTDPATATVTMVQVDGASRLAYVTGAFSHGTTVKAIVRARRTGPPEVDSPHAVILEAEADTQGPDVPDSGIYHSDQAEEAQGG